MKMERPRSEEKGLAQESAVSDRVPATYETTTKETEVPVSTPFQSLNTRIEPLAGLEARGIERVPPEERQESSNAADVQVAVLWFSANLSLNNLATGLFGPMIFGLGFLDSALLAVFGALLGSCSTAYMATWGPRSGNRTMVSWLDWSAVPHS